MASQSDDVLQLTGRLAGTLGTGFTALAISMGVELGLFEKMATYTVPQSSAKIAEDTGCKERYIREWLNLLLATDWVMYEEQTGKYYMTHAQKAVLTSPISLFMPAIKHAPYLYSQLKPCFAKDGPNGFDPEGLFNACLAKWMLGSDTEDYLNGILDTIPHVRERIENKARVCEIGSGHGSLLSAMSKKFPASIFVGSDLCATAIEEARNRFIDNKVSNLSFEVQDVGSLPSDWTDTFDVVISRDVIHDLPNANKALLEILRIMKKGAIYVMVEIFASGNVVEDTSLPMASFFYGSSLFNCLPSSMNGENPAGLGTMMGAKRGEELLVDAGFSVDQFVKYQMFMICVGRKL